MSVAELTAALEANRKLHLASILCGYHSRNTIVDIRLQTIVPAVEAVDEGTEGALALALAEFRNGHLQAIMVMLEQKHQCDVLAGTVDEIEANCWALAEEHLTGIIHLSELLPPRPGAALRERAESSQNCFRAMANDALRMAQSMRDRAQTLYAEVPHDGNWTKSYCKGNWRSNKPSKWSKPYRSGRICQLLSEEIPAAAHCEEGARASVTEPADPPAASATATTESVESSSSNPSDWPRRFKTDNLRH
jgi:hypothetical protein